MRVRPLPFYGVIASMLCVYCTRTIGGTFAGQGTFSDGEPCSQASDCASFNCVGQTCLAPSSGKAEIDAPCNADGDCIMEATCNSGVCIQAYPGPSSGNGGSTSGTGGSAPMCMMDGAFCSLDSDCCGGHCNSTTCSSVACMDAGGFCSSDSDCCSGLYCDTGNSNMCVF
jgi:hypothetical protein